MGRFSPKRKAEGLERIGNWKASDRDRFLASKKDYYDRNKHRWPEYKAKHRATDGARQTAFAYRLRKYFNMTVSDYDLMLVDQGDACAICGLVNNDRRMVVDHCHSTGRVRGLLCSTCNLGLGHFSDEPALLFAALEYLERDRKDDR